MEEFAIVLLLRHNKMINMTKRSPKCIICLISSIKKQERRRQEWTNNTYGFLNPNSCNQCHPLNFNDHMEAPPFLPGS